MLMPSVNEIIAQLERVAPLELAESWDNVGLLVGDRGRDVRRLMTCLTLTPTTVGEAIERQVDLVVVHHPLPFKPVAQVTTDSVVGRLLWELIGARIAVYSAHTAFDSAREGINQRLAEGLKLDVIEPLSDAETVQNAQGLGAGRYGTFETATTLRALAADVKRFLSIAQVRVVGDIERTVRHVGIACGSGGSFLSAAHAKACDCLVTGEANFHTCLEAEAIGMSLILTGHYASERFAMERLAEALEAVFRQIDVWPSQRERDPLAVL